jgi:hypothetical protein
MKDSDNLKSLLKEIPQVEPRWSSGQLLLQVLKQELALVWEKRLSLLSAAVCLIFGLLTINQIFKMAEILGTLGFWSLFGNGNLWLLNEPKGFFLALREAHPWLEIVYLFFLLTILIFSGYILLKSTKIVNMKKNQLTIFLLLFLILGVIGSGFFFFSSVRNRLPPLIQESPPEPIPSDAPDSGVTGFGSSSVSATPENPNFFLEVDSPAEGITIKSPSVSVSGRTHAGVEVFINEQMTTADKNGNFRLTLLLEEGENPILIVAGNEFGDAVIERIVYYELE